MVSIPMITYRGVVYPWHCDHMGHMNVTWYTAKFDEATWNVFTSIGITASYVRDNRCGMVAVEQHIQYKRELAAGDVILVRSRVLDVRTKVIQLVHDLIRVEDTELAATSKITGVHLNLETRKSSAFPKSILDAAEAMTAAGSPREQS